MGKIAFITLGALLLGSGAAAQPPADLDAPINLLCVGQGERMESGSGTTMEWDKYDHKYRYKNTVQTEMKSFESAVTLQIYGGDGRIRLPKKLIPPINSGGDDQHWWQLHNIQTTPDEIRASYKLNGVNQPQIKIDRTTGIISIKGYGQDFQGRCDKVDPGARRFLKALPVGLAGR